MRRQSKLPDLAAMVAVASGTTANVNRWFVILTEAGIPAAVAQCCEFDPLLPDYAELWVRRREVDEARSALRGVRTGRPGAAGVITRREVPSWLSDDR